MGILNVSRYGSVGRFNCIEHKFSLDVAND